MILRLLILVSICVGRCVGQDIDDTKPEIYSLNIQSDILMRYSTTLVTSRLANPLNASTEAIFSVTLPNEAFISNFTLEIDGVIYPGEIKDKATAKKQFEKAKKKGQSAGHVTRARETNRFKVNVNVAALSKVTFNLTYQELLRRSRGLYRHRLYIDPGQPVEDMQIKIRIQESRPLTVLRVLPIQTDLLTNEHIEENALAIVDRPSPTAAYITYSPSIEDQTKDSDTGISGQFVVEYDIERALDSGDLLVVNGYFVHFIAPDVEKPIPKDIHFIIDTSGSMNGEKIRQVKDSMKAILRTLHQDDRFNVMEFASNVKQRFKNTMTYATKTNIRDAISYVKSLRAGGGTNINEALLDGIDDLRASLPESGEQRSQMAVFLTDGQASTGVTSTSQIVNNIKKKNEGEFPVFTLAYGKGADWGLIKKIAVQTNGVAKKIYQDSDANLQIANFYDELSVTLLKDVNVYYLSEEGTTQNLTASDFKNYFQGSEMVVAGKLTDTDARTLKLDITSAGSQGKIYFMHQANLNLIDPTAFKGLTSIADLEGITEKLWAYLTIKQAMKEVAKSENKTEIAALKQKVLDLSLKYQFVTPLTSMVVTKPETEEPNDVRKAITTTPKPTTTIRPTPTTTIRPTPGNFVRGLGGGGGRRRGGGGGGGGYGGGGGGDPHYILRVPGFEHPICFDVKSNHDEVQHILTDPNKHVTINARIIQADIVDMYGDRKTFIGQLSVTLRNHVIIITPNMILFDTKVHLWTKTFEKRFGNNTLVLSKENHTVTITFKDGAELVIARHMKEKREPGGVNFLSMYINHEDGFSKRSTGLLGQFVNGHKHLTLKKIYKNDGGKTMAKIEVKNLPDLTALPDPDTDNMPVRLTVRARLVTRHHVMDSVTESCWMVHQPFVRALLGDRKTFIGTSFLPVN